MKLQEVLLRATGDQVVAKEEAEEVRSLDGNPPKPLDFQGTARAIIT
jgi:hypothetical protein